MKKRIIILFRRKREGKTDYKKRLKLLASKLPRIVVRTSLKNVTVQVVAYEPDGDKVLGSAHSRELIKMGWKAYRKNHPACYLVGLLCGIRVKDKIKKAILDTGLKTPVHGSTMYAAVKGILDAGVQVPHDAKVLPGEERITGKLAKTVEPKMFESVKEKIMKVAK